MSRNARSRVFRGALLCAAAAVLNAAAGAGLRAEGHRYLGAFFAGCSLVYAGAFVIGVLVFTHLGDGDQ